MLQVVLSLLSIYAFVLLGFVAKRAFEEDISERTLTLLAVYFLQPILVFWGILQRPIDFSLILAPAIFMGITLLVTLLTFIIAQCVFSESKDRSIFTVGPTIANTGTLGITTGWIVLGPESIPYTSMMNLINVIFCFGIGAYVYSRGSFSILGSMKNVLTLPMIWAAIVAIIINYLGIPIGERLDRVLEMGAYASIVVQLMLFGVYLSSARPHLMHYGFMASVSGIKLLLLPLIGFLLLPHLGLEPLVAGAIMIVLLSPMAVNNINLSSLYHCKPRTVTELVFATSLLYIVVLPVGVWVMERVIF